MQLRISLTPRTPIVTRRQLSQLSIAQTGTATRSANITVNNQRVKEQLFWEAWPTEGHSQISSIWPYDDGYAWWGSLSWDGDCAKVQNTNYDFTPDSLLDILNRVDFTVASVFSVVPGWWSKPKMYRPPGFSDGHFSNGSFAAFSRDDGHARLVSRRWLDHGPWRLLRDEDTDLTLVQYHDLQATEADALEQAYPGHEAMGIRPHGGFIQTDFVFGKLKPGLYERETRTVVAVVPGQEQVTPRQMLEAAAMKLWQPLEEPVDQVAFVFTDEGNARKHLHDLWLRGLEVRFVGTRLDDQFDPGPPATPDWVKAVQDREGF